MKTNPLLALSFLLIPALADAHPGHDHEELHWILSAVATGVIAAGFVLFRGRVDHATNKFGVRRSAPPWMLLRRRSKAKGIQGGAERRTPNESRTPNERP